MLNPLTCRHLAGPGHLPRTLGPVCNQRRLVEILIKKNYKLIIMLHEIESKPTMLHHINFPLKQLHAYVVWRG